VGSRQILEKESTVERVSVWLVADYHNSHMVVHPKLEGEFQVRH
jgi:hypothetical protein